MSSVAKSHFALLGLVIFLISACSRDPEATMERARQLAADGDLPAATIEMKSAIQNAPQNAEMRLFLGELYLRQYASPTAIKELERALSLGIGAREVATLALAEAYFRANDREKIHKLEVEESYSAEAKASLLAMQGHAFAREKSTPEAREKLKAARELDADSGAAYLLAAQLKLYEREIDAAYQEIDALLENEPKHEIALIFKAKVARVNRQPEIELAALDRILADYPRNYDARVARSNLYIGSGDLDSARADVRFLSKNFPRNPMTKVQSALLKLSEGNPSKALDLAREAMSQSPELSNAKLVAGLAQKKLGALDRAADLIRSFINAVPNNVYSRLQLAEIYLTQGNAPDALNLLQPLVRLGFEDPALFNLGAVALHALGEAELAEKWFAKAAELAPEDGSVATSKALAMLESGDIEGGLEGLEAALNGSATVGAIDELLILTLVQRGENARALQILQSLEQKAPDSAFVANIRGLVEVARGDSQAARAAFERAVDTDPDMLAAVTNLSELDAREGDVERAIQRFEDYLANHEKTVPAYLSLATLQAKFGFGEQARSTLEKAVEIAPNDKSVVMPLIAEYLRLGRNREAESIAFIAQKANPNDTALIKALAEAELRSGAKNKAMGTVERLLALSSRSAETYVDVASFQFRAGKPDAAEQTLRSGLRAFPGKAPLHIQMMAMFTELRAFDKAEKHAKTVQEQNPNAPFGYLIGGELQEVLGDFEAAVALYDTALDKEPAGPFAVKRFAAANNIDRDSALAWLQKWVDENPGQAAARGRFADELSRDGRFGEAIGHYEKMIDDKTFQVFTLNALAWAYYQVGDERAQTLAEAAYVQGGFSPYVADTLGWVLVEKGDLQGGMPYLEKAARRAPDNAAIMLHFAEALIRAERSKDARETLEKVLKLPLSDSDRQLAEGFLQGL